MIAGLVGLLVGMALGVLVGVRLARRRAYLVCQRQALRDNAPRPVISGGYNPVPPRQRRRSPDEKPFWQHFPARQRRPVFDDRR